MLASTREVAVDGFAFTHYRYDLQVRALEKRFHKETAKVALSEVRYRLLGSGALQLLFIPSDQAAFNTLTQPIDELPSLVQRPESIVNFGLVTTLEQKRLVGGSALKSAWDELHDAVANGNLSYAAPDQITGPNRMMWVPETPPEWPLLAS
ncbi:MAG TPA: hypothetical protein VN081_01470 [Dongiaceae bacterium]|nr:hypothetical protein [Dongiaceae bacterium]